MSEISEQEAKESAGMYEDTYVIRDLQQQIREKEARIARLETICTDITCEHFDLQHAGDLERFEDKVVSIYRESPQQSAAHIQAEAVEKYNQSFVGLVNQMGFANIGNASTVFAKEYAQQLREADKG